MEARVGAPRRCRLLSIRETEEKRQELSGVESRGSTLSAAMDDGVFTTRPGARAGVRTRGAGAVSRGREPIYTGRRHSTPAWRADALAGER